MFYRLFLFASLLVLHSWFAITSANTVIRAAMHTDLRLTDPHATTAYIATWHGYMIYDTLLALDEKFVPQPQMLEKWEVSQQGKTYIMTLRPGLMWHDQTPVTAEDAVLSIRRWAEGDIMGKKLLSLTKSLTVLNAQQFQWDLSEATDLPIRALSKPSGTTPFILPARIAKQPIGQPITDMTGSGPFQIETFQPGVKTVYKKNTAYVPRPEPSSGLAGGKVVKVDRVEWKAFANPLTATQAILKNEIDYIELFDYDLLPMIADKPQVVETNISPVGYYTMLRFNFLHPPFNDRRLRQAAMLAIDQKHIMQAMVGNPKYWKTCASLWGCGTPLESSYGLDILEQAHIEKAKALLKEAQYDQTPVVILQATDIRALQTQPLVIAEALRKVGFNVKLVPMDWQSIAIRRASKAAPTNKGWSIFNTNWYATDLMDPTRSAPAAASGDSAWFGWPQFPEIEKLRDAFALTTDVEEQKRIADTIQRIGIDEGLYVPLGQTSTSTVHTRRLKGIVRAPAVVFWNMYFE